MTEIEKLKADNELLRAQLVQCTRAMLYVSEELFREVVGRDADDDDWLSYLAEALVTARATPVTLDR